MRIGYFRQEQEAVVVGLGEAGLIYYNTCSMAPWVPFRQF